MKTYQITKLDKEEWKGHVLPVEYTTSEYYDVSKTASSDGFLISLRRKKFTAPVRHYPEEYDFPDKLYQDHWQGAEAFGVLESGRLIAAIELYRESWANRLRVTELWVDENHRRQGIGAKLLDLAKEVAAREKMRMVILETQSCNVAAIDFYLSQKMDLVGVLTCDYANNDIERKEVRLEMGFFLPS